MDMQTFGLVIPALIAAWGVTRADAGLIGGVTLVTSALGGWLGGALSDRLGRVRALQLAIVWFASATVLAAVCQSYPQLLLLRAAQGLGFGGEWAAGAVLMAEVIRPDHRGKVLGAVQSGWAVGWGAAIAAYCAVFGLFSADPGWRILFALGGLPAVPVLLALRGLPGPVRRSAAPRPVRYRAALLGIFGPSTRRATLVGGLLGLGAHGGYYGLFTWLPTFLVSERRLSVAETGLSLAVVVAAFGTGCLVAGGLLDRIGRRRTVILFATTCAILAVCYPMVRLAEPGLTILGGVLGFAAAGIPASMGALFNELYPAGLRGSGVGFCYNAGRLVAAGLPVLVGHLAEVMPLGTAIGAVSGLAYALVVLAVLLLPETKGIELDGVPGATGSLPAAFPATAAGPIRSGDPS